MATEDSQRFAFVDRVQTRISDSWFAYLMVFPVVLYLIVLVWYPYMQGIYMSLFDWPLFGERSWVGLDNYVYLLTWDVFHKSVVVTLIYGLQTIGHLFFGTIMALIVWKQKRWKGLLSVLFLVPYIIPPLVSGTLFRFILQPDVGPFFQYLVGLGVLESPIYWTTYGDTALLGITLIGVWTWSSLVFILVYSSLESIPKDYYETAEVYGANTWEKFTKVTYPQIKSTLLIALILRIIWNLGKVTQPFQITRGGPGFETSVLGILLYRLAWRRQELGLAFAAGIILGLIALVFVIVFVWKFEQTSGEVPA